MPTVGEAANVAEIAGYMVVLSLVVWLVRRVFTYTIPRLADDYKKSLERQQDIFTAALDKQQSLLQTSLAQQRADFKESLEKERADCKEVLQEEREFIGEKLDRLSGSIEQLIGRDGHHGV